MAFDSTKLALANQLKTEMETIQTQLEGLNRYIDDLNHLSELDEDFEYFVDLRINEINKRVILTNIQVNADNVTSMILALMEIRASLQIIFNTKAAEFAGVCGS